MQSCPLRPLRKDHLERLRHARRLGHVQDRPGAAMHLHPRGASDAAVPVEPRLIHRRHARPVVRRDYPSPGVITHTSPTSLVP